MKQPTLKKVSALTAMMLLGFSSQSLVAASGNWTNDASSVWGVATNWNSNPTVPGTAPGDSVGLNYNITAARTVTIDTTARTVGSLTIGDPTASFFSYTLANSGGSYLIFDNSGSGASLTQPTTGGAADTISAPIALNDNLTIANVNGLTLSGVISNSTTFSTVVLTKNGAGMLTLSGANTYVPSSITVNGGTLYCPRTGANAGTSSAYGNISGGGVNIYVNTGATLSSGNNNWFGNQTVPDGNLPTVNISGGILALTNNYTTIGSLNLTNGAVVTSTGTGSGNYYGFQLRGSISVGGTSGSTISGSRDYHLGANTAFNVNATGGAGPDLTVSANLRNQSGDFANAAGAFTLNGNGVMRITSTGSTFTGGATINSGTLQLGDGASANGAITANISDSGTLVFADPSVQTYSGVISGGGSVVKMGAGALTLSGANSYGGSTTVSNGTVIITATQSGSGAVTVMDGATLGVTATANSTYLSPVTLMLGSNTGMTLQFGVVSTTTAPINPGTLTLNGTTTINISSCPFINNISYPLLNNYTTGTLILGTQPTAVQGQLVINSGTVYYQVTNVVMDIWTAAVNTNWDIVTANWTNAAAGNLFVSNYPVQFDDSASGASPLLVNITNAVTPGAVTFSNMTKSYTVGGLAIAGATGVTMSGTNTVTLSGVNTFTGPITISAGTVAIGGAGKLGNGTYAGAINDAGIFNYNSSVAQTLSSVISGSGAVTVTGTGALTLNNNSSSYSGGFTNFGSVIYGAGSSGGNGPFGSGTITLMGGTVFTTTGSGAINNNVNVAAGTTVLGANTGGGNPTLGGAITGTGTIANSTTGVATSSAFTGDLSGFQGTFNFTNYSTSNIRFGTASTVNQVFNAAQANFILTLGSGSTRNMAIADGSGGSSLVMGSLSGNGVIEGTFYGSGGIACTYAVGALNTSTTFSGRLSDSTSGNQANFSLVKLGTGTLTLAGNQSLYSGGTILSNGIISLATNNLASSGPLGTGAITFAGGTLQYGTFNTNDYSGRIANSSGPISIDVNGTNVTFVTALPSSNTGGLMLTNSTGAGILTLSAAEAYTGNTTINAGRLALSGSGSIAASTNISVAGGATFDVSGVSYTLGGSQTLSGSGTVTGAVTSAAVGSFITPGGAGAVGTLTFRSNLNLAAGASPVFDLSTSHSSGNDQIVVAGNLTMTSSDTVHIDGLSGSANLDQSGDYILFSAGGTLSMASQPSLAFDGTAPGNAAHYSVKSSGNNVVLHYSATTGPQVISVIVTNIVDGTATAVRGESVTVYATVTPGLGTVTNVSANLSSIGGPASQTLTALGGNNYSYTLQVAPNAPVGSDLIFVTATDTTPLSGSGSATLTVNASAETWNGLAGDNNWTSGNNWVSTYPPGYVGDSLIFAGSTQANPNMNTNYNVASLVFDSSASSFVIGSTTGNSLTLAGGVTNNSSSAQSVNVPVVLSGTETVNDINGAGVAFGGSIAGTGGLTIANASLGNPIVTLGGADTYTGNTTIPLFATLKVANSAALPSGSGTGNILDSGTLDLSGTNATVNGLTDAGTVDNSGANPVTLTVGSGDGAGSVSGTIQNSGAALTLSKAGTNVFTIAAANTHSGGTVLNSGSIIFQHTNAFGSGTLTLAGGNLVKSGGNIIVVNPVNVTGTVNIGSSSGGDPEFMGPLTGSGTLNVPNATLAGVAPGNASLKLEGDLSGFTGTFSQTTIGIANNGLRLRLSAAGLGAVLIDCSQATIVTAGSTSAGYPVDLGDNTFGTPFRIGALSGTGGILRGGWPSTANTGTNTVFEIGALNTSTTYAGCIQDNPDGSTGLSGITKVGIGTLTLTGPNSYSGPTTVSNGALNVYTTQTGGGAFTVADGTTFGVTSIAAGSLKVSSLTLGSGNGCTNNLSGVSSTVIAVITNTGTLTLAGTVTLNIQGAVSVGQYPLIGSAGGITGSGGFVLGSLPLGAVANIATNGNTIVLNVTTAPTAQVWTGSVNTNWDYATANWSLSGSPGLYTDSMPATFSDAATRTAVNLATTVTPLGITVSNNAKNFTFTSSSGAQITGSSAVTKNGPGMLTMLGMSNNFTGGFSIIGGTVSIDGGANLGNGTVDLQGILSPVQGFALAQNLALGPVSGSGSGTITVGSGITLTNNTAMTDYGSGSGTLVKTGTGTLQLAGNSTYSGGTVVSNGTLILTTGGGTGTVRGALTIVAGATAIATVQDALGYNAGQCTTPVNIVGGLLDNQSTNNEGYITTFNLTGGTMSSSSGGAYNFNGASGAINTLASSSVSTISGPVVLRANGLNINTAQGTVPGGVDLNISGVISGAGNGLVKVGAGTLALTALNTYTGTTTVSNGTLLVNGSVAGPATVNGGTLGGTGSVTGATVVGTGGTLAPGTSATGTININNSLTLAGNTLVKLNKNLSPAQSNDFVNVTGALSYGGTLTVTNIGSALALGNSFRVFPSGGTGSLTVSGNAGSGLAFSFADGLLSVVAGGPTGPGVITNSISGSTLHLTWPSGQGWRLVSQTNSLSTGLSAAGWSTVSGTTDGNYSITIDASKPTVFYELVYP